VTVTTIGDWAAGTMVALIFLTAASGLLMFPFAPSRERLALLIRCAVVFTAAMLRRTRFRRTAARTPGRHQAGTVAPVAVPVPHIPGYDAAQTAMLTARAVTLLEDTAVDIPAWTPEAEVTRDDLKVITDRTGGTIPGVVVGAPWGDAPEPVTMPSGHYAPWDLPGHDVIAELIRRDQRDGNYVEPLPRTRMHGRAREHFARQYEGRHDVSRERAS
jgi:hypothetical protein